MTAIDWVVVLVAVLAATRGWRRGLLAQFFEFGGGFLGLVAGIALGPRIASTLTDAAGPTGVLISLVVVLLALSVGQAAGYVVGRKFGSLARRIRLGGLDVALGAAFGVLITLVSYWLLGSLLVGSSIRPLAVQLRRSKLLAHMNELSEPPDVLAYIRQYLSTSQFPQVFTGWPQPVGSPVELPTGRQARRAFRAADGSTVRIVVPACGGTQLGSGWIAADSTVVTNAHVVAGGGEVTVQEASETHAGRVVLFDGEVDLAVVRTDDPLAGAPLSLTTEALESGASGVTLGYPGGDQGQLVPSRAAVRLRFRAEGLDIYGRSIVRRQVYELRADVREGDSGGPFVLPDGKVAGVVFAASTTDAGIGYALTGAEVADEVEAGIGSTRAVETGGCIR